MTKKILNKRKKVDETESENEEPKILNKKKKVAETERENEEPKISKKKKSKSLRKEKIMLAESEHSDQEIVPKKKKKSVKRKEILLSALQSDEDISHTPAGDVSEDEFPSDDEETIPEEKELSEKDLQRLEVQKQNKVKFEKFKSRQMTAVVGRVSTVQQLNLADLEGDEVPTQKAQLYDDSDEEKEIALKVQKVQAADKRDFDSGKYFSHKIQRQDNPLQRARDSSTSRGAPRGRGRVVARVKQPETDKHTPAVSSRGRGDFGQRGNKSRGFNTGSRGRSEPNANHHQTEDLHPSWQAKKNQAASIQDFQGKRTTFD